MLSFEIKVRLYIVCHTIQMIASYDIKKGNIVLKIHI